MLGHKTRNLSLAMYHVTVRDSYARTEGGALAIDTGRVELELRNCTFMNNRAGVLSRFTRPCPDLQGLVNRDTHRYKPAPFKRGLNWSRSMRWFRAAHL